jgi:hypothetical protein
LKYVVKLKDGREFEGVRTVPDAVCPLGLSLLKRDYPDSTFKIPSATGEEIRITFENVLAIEVIF